MRARWKPSVCTQSLVLEAGAALGGCSLRRRGPCPEVLTLLSLRAQDARCCHEPHYSAWMAIWGAPRAAAATP